MKHSEYQRYNLDVPSFSECSKQFFVKNMKEQYYVL